MSTTESEARRLKAASFRFLRVTRADTGSSAVTNSCRSWTTKICHTRNKNWHPFRRLIVMRFRALKPHWKIHNRRH
jgi:hypothetical protein